MELKLRLDKSNMEKAQNFFKFYEFETMVGNSGDKFFMGEKNIPRSCRFCKRTRPQVKFKKDAHVIPQFMGNENLLSYFECDSCNELFSKYETSFSNFFGITRTFAQIKGQNKKVPKFIDKKNQLDVSVNDTGIQMTTQEGFNPIILDDENKTLTIETERPGYVPIDIPKIIIKMGFCLLEEDEVDKYEFCRKFIQPHIQDESFINNSQLRIYGYFIPGPPKYPTPFLQLYKKKEIYKNELLPTRHIILYYANYCFQMIFPFDKNDEAINGKEITVPIFPLLVDNSYFQKYGNYQKLNLNFTSNQKKSGEKHTTSFSFENSIDLTTQ